MPIEIEGLPDLDRFINKLESEFNAEFLLSKLLEIARQGGEDLKRRVEQQCVDEIYAIQQGTMTASTTPLSIRGGEYQYGGLDETRTNALFDAHEVVDEGLTQTVRIDPTAAAEGGSRPGREYVSDYAHYVHNGYFQWVMGKPHGPWHIGRPWFDHAVEFYGYEITQFVIDTFMRVIDRVFV